MLKENGSEKLELKRDQYTWTDSAGDKVNDGPTMLKLIVDMVNPLTRVGIDNLMKKIEGSTLAKYNNDVDDMLESMQTTYDKIINDGYTYPHYIRYLFAALLSGANVEFTRTIQRLKDSWDTGEDITPEKLVDTATSKFNNMMEDKTWMKKDPKDAKIAALTTLVEQLVNNKPEGKAAYATGANLSTSKGETSKSDKLKDETIPGCGQLKMWRSKKGANKITREGRTWYWCPHHKHPRGTFDGLYMTHKPEHHDEWRDRRNQRKKTVQQTEKTESEKSSKADQLLLTEK